MSDLSATTSATVTPPTASAKPRRVESLLVASLAVATLLAGAIGGLQPAIAASAGALFAIALLGLPRRPADATRTARGLAIVGIGAWLAVSEPALGGMAILCSLTVAATFPMHLSRLSGYILTILASCAVALPVIFESGSGNELGTATVTASLVGVLVILATGMFATTTARSLQDAYTKADLSASEALHTQAKLSHAILHDRLTGLPNKDALLARVVRSLAHAQELGGTIGVLVLAVDRFDAVKNSLGDRGADEVLGHVALRLRASRPEHDMVARLGQAEFGVVIEGVGPEGCSGIARRMTALLAEPVTANGSETSVTCSVGVVLSSPDLGTGADLLRAAEEANRAAQASGRSRWAEFDRAMRAHTVSQAFLELELRQVLRSGGLGVVFNPIMAIGERGNGERVASLEAVPRWVRKDGTAVPPTRFLTMAEDLGLGPTLGFQVLDRALEALAEWQREGAATPQVTVGASRSQLTDPDFAQSVSARLAASGLAADCLAVEIGGPDLDDDDVLSTLAMLRSLGVTVCVDGLGRSGSSLANLGVAPIDRVIIDHSLVAGPGTGQTVARHLVALCRELQLETVADGVETDDQLAVVKILGVGHARGFLFGRPVAAEDVLRSQAAWTGLQQLPTPRTPTADQGGAPMGEDRLTLG